MMVCKMVVATVKINVFFIAIQKTRSWARLTKFFSPTNSSVRLPMVMFETL